MPCECGISKPCQSAQYDLKAIDDIELQTVPFRPYGLISLVLMCRMKVTAIYSYLWCLTNVGHQNHARTLKLQAVNYVKSFSFEFVIHLEFPIITYLCKFYSLQIHWRNLAILLSQLNVPNYLFKLIKVPEFPCFLLRICCVLW
jgi:hypothetical protein